MKRSTYLILLFFLVSSVKVFGQESKSEITKPGTNKAISVTFNPIFLFNNTIKLDAELQTKKPWAVIVGAEFYSGGIKSLYSQSNNFNEPVDDEIGGFGVNLAIKYKFDQSGDVNSYYFSPGLTYRQLNLTLNGPAYYSYMQDGIEYYTYGATTQSQKVSPVVLYGNIGRYYELGSIVIDVYCGLGYKILNQNEELLKTRKYHKAMFGYNYDGAIFQVGIKLGWQITK